MRRIILALIMVFAVCAPAQAASASPESEFLQAAYNIHTSPVLICIRHHESDHQNPPLYDQGYGAINTQGSGAAGAYQFLPSTWDATAAHFGLLFLVGQPPQLQYFFIQDVMATLLLIWQGPGPWAGSGCG